MHLPPLRLHDLALERVAAALARGRWKLLVVASRLVDRRRLVAHGSAWSPMRSAVSSPSHPSLLTPLA